MKNQKSILIILFVSILSFSSCKDDDDASGNPATAEQTNTEKLCGKNFIITDFTLIENGVTIMSGLDSNLFSPCEIDDIFRYETNGTATINDGATKCDPTNPQIETSTWAFYDSETKIIFEPGPDADTNDIITNDGTVLIYGGREIYMGDTLEYTQTFRAQ